MRFSSATCAWLVLLSACTGQVEFHGPAKHRIPALTEGPEFGAKGFAQTPLGVFPSTAPTELGGSVTGSFFANADRIDVTVVMTSGSATFKLLYWNAGNGIWQPIDASGWLVDSADTVNSPNKTREARVVSKRGPYYYQVYKAAGSGTVASCSLEIAYNSAGSGVLGPIEPPASLSPSGAAGGSLSGTYPNPGLASTTVTAASYPSAGQIPTFTVAADGRLTAAGSTTTITSPSISGPTFSGTEGGTRTIGGTPTLGTNLAAGGFKITNLGAATTTGDALAWPVPAGALTSAGLPGATYQICGGTSAAIGAGLTRFASGVNGATLTTSFACGVVAAAKTMRNMACLTNTSAGSLTATAQYYDGAAWNDSAIVTTNTTTAGPGDTTHTQNLSANYAVGFKLVASGGYAGNYVTCCIEVWPQ